MFVVVVSIAPMQDSPRSIDHVLLGRRAQVHVFTKRNSTKADRKGRRAVQTTQFDQARLDQRCKDHVLGVGMRMQWERAYNGLLRDGCGTSNDAHDPL